MPSGMDGGMGIQAASWNVNPYLGLDPEVQKYLTAGDFGNAFKSAEAAPNVGLYGNTQLRDLLTPSYLSGVNWNSSNINDYYSALGQYGSKIDPTLLGDLATHGGNTQASNGNGGNSNFIGGSLGLTPQDIAAAEKANLAAGGAPNALQYDYTPNEQNGHLGGVFGDITTGVGQAVAPLTKLAIAAGFAAAGGAGAGALAGAAGAGAGTLGGAVATGAGAGAAGSVATSGMNGTPITWGSVGKGAALGGLSGGIANGLSPVTQGLVDQGVNPTLAGGIVRTGVGAVNGAVGGALSGQGAGAGALSGAEHGAISSATNAVGGSIFGGNSTIFNSGDAANPTNNPSLSNPTAPGTMDDSLNPIDTTGQYAYSNGDGSVTGGGTLGGSNPGFTDLGVQGGGSTLGGGYTDANGNTTAGNLTGAALAKFLGGMGVGAGNGSSGGGSGNSSLLSSLAGLLTGSGGSGNANLLAQLLGMGATGVGGALSSSAAKGAAGNFAGQTKYAPYSVTTNNGTNSFNGTNATSTLSPQEQAVSTGLNGLTTQAAGDLAKGTAGTQAADFNALQASQLQAQQRLLGNTQDNEFANGVLGSTAGQYQTQGALGAIGQQTAQDETQAQTMAGQQQQQQLAQLTAGLSGSNTINGSQLAGLNLGGTIGSAASGANVSAFSPSLAANSNSNIGTLLQGIGNGATTNPGNANNSALQTYLAGLMKGGG